MRPKLLINDVHLGVQRVTGTTPKTAAALRENLHIKLRDLLMAHTDKDVVINGDLFDTFNVPMQDVLQFYMVASAWLDASEAGDTQGTFRGDLQPKLFLGRGNHDIAKDSSKMSSFDFVGQILRAQYGSTRVVVVTEPTLLEEGLYMIPHMPNQDLFDLALKRCEEFEGCVVLLHANYDNNFAVESDHSLNVSQEQAKALVAKGHRLVFGHEHQGRRLMKNKVWITGNQWPSSIADCLNNPNDGNKHAHVIECDVLVSGETAPILSAVPTWSAADSFIQVPWDELSLGAADNAEFVRVTGKASAEQASAVIETVAKFRQRSEAFVVTNAVEIEGMANMTELATTAENLKAFDVTAYLFENLDPEQVEAVKALLAKDARIELREAA
jgi:metallophosphoesterase superfamily enzyme